MISFKGTALGKWFDFTKSSLSKFLSNKVVIKESLAGKKGAVKFNTPVFELGDALTTDEANKANTSYDAVAEYLSLPTIDDVKDIEDIEVIAAEDLSADEPDDLPF